jgi:hypothetical protein
VAFEVVSAQTMSLWSLHYLGRIGEISARLPELLKDARQRGDLYAATNLRTSHTNIVWLAADEPNQAQTEIAEAMREWSPSGFHLPNYYELHGLAQNELYRGDAVAAWQRVERGFPLMKSAFLLELQIVRIEMHYLRARAALASAAQSGDAAKKLSQAERDARAIERESTAWGNALALLIHAAVAATRGHSDAADRFQTAADHLQGCSMHLHALAARYRRGQLLGGDRGNTLVREAEDAMQREAIRRPDRFVPMLAPSRP